MPSCTYRWLCLSGHGIDFSCYYLLSKSSRKAVLADSFPSWHLQEHNDSSRDPKSSGIRADAFLWPFLLQQLLADQRAAEERDEEAVALLLEVVSHAEGLEDQVGLQSARLSGSAQQHFSAPGRHASASKQLGRIPGLQRPRTAGASVRLHRDSPRLSQVTVCKARCSRCLEMAAAAFYVSVWLDSLWHLGSWLLDADALEDILLLQTTTSE